MIHHLSIDIETFSSVPIGDAGAQRYTASDDFEILLFAYSVDGQPVQVIDLACGEKVPFQIISALTDPDYIKHAYNASFEFGCLSKVFGPMIPSQWRCTMVHGLYCGYTAGLDATGRALGLPEDKQKLSTGKALIKYFCTPCKPTKSNGGRTRNYPRHDPEKWQLFKEYNGQDVVAEMEIERRLSEFPVPDEVQRQWETDLAINTRGVAVDMDFVHGALDIGEGYKAGLMEEAARLTGLSNPNSVSQLLGWVNARLNEAEQLADLRKDTVSRTLQDADLLQDLPEVMRALQIRQELGKTSTKKYDAIEACVCPDGRVRGLLQFYGANRTGRFAGRLVQVQNLPRTYTDPIELARELVKDHDADALQVVYGSISDTLSQLIRTAFVSSPGNVLIDADFSAIEARVISWLAGEQWRLDVFQTHGKIYEASASQMFGVPIELIKKGNPEYALRAKGKVAELALGYQGGPGALTAMGALDMGLTEEELPDIVRRWRTANSHISGLWYKIEEKVLALLNGEGTQRISIKEWDPLRARENEKLCGAVPGTYTNWFNNGAELVFRREHSRIMDRACMSIELPSGRKLFYVDPQVGQNRWGKPSITYWGVNQTTKKWEPNETYGGKLTENCLAGHVRVVTNNGIKRLTDVTVSDLLWDGRDWVRHGGVIRKGIQPTISVNGIVMTADHRILTNRGWQSASQSSKYRGPKNTLFDSSGIRRIGREKVTMENTVRLWKRVHYACLGVQKREAEIVRVHAECADIKKQNEARYVEYPNMECLAFHDRKMRLPYFAGLGELWRTWNKGLREMEDLREFLCRYGNRIPAGSLVRSHRRGRALCAGKLQMGFQERAGKEQAQDRLFGYPKREDGRVRSRGGFRHRIHDPYVPAVSRMAQRFNVHTGGRNEQAVFDIMNAGPKHRFAVLDENNEIIIVHNCVQAIARDCLCYAIENLEAAGYPIVFHVHDEVVIDMQPYADNGKMLEDVCSIMKRRPPWAQGLPLDAAGWVGDFFTKD